MPIQVIYSNKQHLYGNVRADAGEDKVFTCRSVVTMEAKVVGDTRGHTFQWEQIDGEPVEFLSPTNQPSMTFTFDVKEDKQFRFWIDRGTLVEQYDDVWAWQTPTEQHYFASKIPRASHWGRPRDTNAQENSVAHVITEFSDYETALRGYASSTDTNKAIFWTLPSDSNYITHYVVQRWQDGEWVDFLLVGPEIRYVSIENNFMYRVLTYFQYPERYGKKYYIHASNNIRVTSAPEPFAESAGITGNTFIANAPHEVTAYDVMQRFLIGQAPAASLSPNTNSFISKDALKLTGYDVLQRVVVKFQPPASLAPNTNSTVSRAGHEITNFNVLDLINIEIGSELDLITIGG